MIFVDTSALAKRYVLEPGSAAVIRMMEEDSAWSASALALAEVSIMLCQADLGRADLGPDGREGLRRHLELDWGRFLVVPADADCLAAATSIGCEQRVRTIDAIHLAAAMRLPPPVTFVSFDQRQSDAARALGLDVLPV